MFVLLDYNSPIEGPIFSVDRFADLVEQRTVKLLLLENLAHHTLRINSLSLFLSPKRENILAKALNVNFEYTLDFLELKRGGNRRFDCGGCLAEGKHIKFVYVVLRGLHLVDSGCVRID